MQHTSERCETRRPLAISAAETESHVAADGDRTVVEVTDEGPGIPDHELAVIDRGAETALEHGSGLGLWFAHWVVVGAGGEIEFDTDGGTTARVTLPDVGDDR